MHSSFVSWMAAAWTVAGPWLFAYLLNALWQAPLIFAAAWLMARVTRRLGPLFEHRLWIGAMLLEITLPACRVQFSDLLAMASSWVRWFAGHGSSSGEVRIFFGPSHALGGDGLRLSPTVLALVGGAYAGTLLYFAGRLAWGFLRTRTLARNAMPTTLAPSAAAFWKALRARSLSSQRAVRFAVSDAIRGPVTIGPGAGLGQPVVLFPAGFLEAVEESGQSDMCAVLAHEYAHICRRDFSWNLVYAIASLPIAWHPLLWLTRLRLAESREMTCDAMAAEAMNGGGSYARSLLRLARLLTITGRFTTIHAIGIFDANILERRIMNLTQKPTELRGLRRVAALSACAIAALVVCTSAMALRMEPITAEAAPQDAANRPKQLHIDASELTNNIVSKVQPVYPPDAKKAGVQGTVVLDIVVGKEGMPEHLDVVSGPHELQQSALDAVRQWRYKPYLLNGEPIEVTSTVNIVYSLGK